MNVKVIAIVAVLVLVAGGASAYIVMNKDSEEKSIEIGYGALEVFGNANGDNKIDSDDTVIIRKIIDGKTMRKSILLRMPIKMGLLMKKT